MSTTHGLALDLAELEVEPLEAAGAGATHLETIGYHGMTEVAASIGPPSCSASCCLACCCCCC